MLGQRCGYPYAPSLVANLNHTTALTSFARTGNATMYDSTGRLTFAPNNMALYSEDFSQATWLATGAGLVATLGPGGQPSGTTKLVSTSGYAYQTVLTAANPTVVWSVELWGTPGNKVGLRMFSNTNANTITQSAVTLSATPTRYYIVASIAFTAGDTGVTFGLDCRSAVVTGATDNQTFYARGGQLEQVTYETTPRAYNKTTAAAYYGPRYPYAWNGSAWVQQGLLVEPQATNLQQYSPWPGIDPWTRTGVTCTTDGTLASDGVTPATKWTSTGVNYQSCYMNTPSSVTANEPLTYSVECQVGTALYPSLGINSWNTGTKGAVAVFDLSTTADGVASQIIADTGVVAWGTKTHLGGGRFRLTITAHGIADVAVYYAVNLAPAATGNTKNWASIAETVAANLYTYFSLSQFERSDRASSYIYNPATGPTTRAADSSWSFAADAPLPSWITHSRAGHAMQYDAAGRLTYAPNNLVNYSDLSSGWTPTRCTVTPNVVDGYASIIEDSTAFQKWTAQSLTGTHLPGNFIMRVRVKPKSGGRGITLLLGAQDSSGGVFAGFTSAFHYIPIDGVLSGSYGTGFSIVQGNDGVLQSDGSYIVSFVIKTTVAQAFAANVYPTDASGTTTYQGDGTSGIYVKDVQVDKVTYETLPRPFNATGASQYFGPRFDHDPVTRLPRGLLPERETTNLFTNSTNLAAAPWTIPTGSTGAYDATALGPDGLPMFKVTGNGSSTSTCIYPSPPPGGLTANANYGVSYYLRPGSFSYWAVMFQASAGNYVTAVFDLRVEADCGTSQVSLGATSGTLVSAKAYYLGGGLWRLTAVVSVNGTTVYPFIEACPAASGNAFNGVGEIVWAPPSGAYFHASCPQLELGSDVTTYIPTAGAAVTRAHDDASGTLLHDLPASRGYSVIVEAEGSPSAGNADYFRAWDASAHAGLEFWINSATDFQTWTSAIPVGTAHADQTVTAGLSAYRWGATLSPNLITASVNGSAVTTAAPASAQPDFNHFTLGSSGTNYWCNTPIRSLAIYGAKLPDAVLRTKTVAGGSY